MKNSFQVFFRTLLPIIIFSFIFYLKGFTQDQHLIDSLKNAIATAKDDTNKIKLITDLGQLYIHSTPDTALHSFQKALKISEQIEAKEFIADCLIHIGSIHQIRGTYDGLIESFQRALKLSKEINDNKKISACYLIIGHIYRDHGSYDTAIINYLAAFDAADEIGDEIGMAAVYNNLGIVYFDQGLYEESIDYYLKALEISEKIGNKINMAACYNNIGSIHMDRSSYDQAIVFLEKALAVNEELGRKLGVSICYHNIGICYHDLGSYDKAIENHIKALRLFVELDHKRGISNCNRALGEIYLDQGLFDKATEYYLKALKTYEELDDKMGIANTNNSIASLNISLADSMAITEIQRLKYLNEAVIYGTKSIVLTKEMELLPKINDAAKTLMEAYKKLGNYKKAIEFAEIFISTQDSMFREDKTRAVQEMSTRYETEKKQQQIELQESQIVAKDSMIKQQKIYRNALAVGFGAVIIIIIVIVYAYVQKRKDNKKIVEQNKLIQETNEELMVLNEAINKQNNEIIDSINYAQRIQSAMLPPETYFSELLNEVFILYEPRDIVSGDFYWIKQVNQYIILAAADCTGHGVPGAFMSMLGISYLNEIVQRREITQANQVLNELRYQIKHSLRQHGQPDESKDGMDMALCVIDVRNKMMQYSGAYNPLYLIRDVKGNPELMEIKADRMPIGYYQGKDKSFINHDLQLEFGDTFYLFSDGFIDQKGGKDNRKFMSKNFKNLLLEIHDQPMYDQKEILIKTLKDWMGGNAQMDDILVVGARV